MRHSKQAIYVIFDAAKGNYISLKDDLGGKPEVKTYNGKRSAQVAAKRLSAKYPKSDLRVQLYQADSQT